MNPVVSTEKLTELLNLYPDMPHYDLPQGAKIPAAWLIEQCGWKGRRAKKWQNWQKPSAPTWK